MIGLFKPRPPHVSSALIKERLFICSTVHLCGDIMQREFNNSAVVDVVEKAAAYCLDQAGS